MSFSKLLVLLFLTACGGSGGDSEDGVVFQGSLVQGSATIRLAHDAGEAIEEVQVCALGECSTTDGNGQWGFRVEQAPTEFELSVIGHGIDSKLTVIIPSTAKDVVIELENHAEGIHAHSVVADGQGVDQEASHNDDGHSHG